MTVGLPRSGKTTWARAQGHPIVCPDEIRLALHGQRYAQEAEPFVWAIARLMVRALFTAGHNTVILDATNVTQKRRDEWESDLWDTVFHVIPTNEEECLARADAERDEEIKPVIRRMAEQFEPVPAERTIEHGPYVSNHIGDALLGERQRVLDAIPPCPQHGPCVPHALVWIERAKETARVLKTTREFIAVACGTRAPYARVMLDQIDSALES
jgi:predicted kinase